MRECGHTADQARRELGGVGMKAAQLTMVKVEHVVLHGGELQKCQCSFSIVETTGIATFKPTISSRLGKVVSRNSERALWVASSCTVLTPATWFPEPSLSCHLKSPWDNRSIRWRYDCVEKSVWGLGWGISLSLSWFESTVGTPGSQEKCWAQCLAQDKVLRFVFQNTLFWTATIVLYYFKTLSKRPRWPLLGILCWALVVEDIWILIRVKLPN